MIKSLPTTDDEEQLKTAIHHLGDSGYLSRTLKILSIAVKKIWPTPVSVLNWNQIKITCLNSVKVQGVVLHMIYFTIPVHKFIKILSSKILCLHWWKKPISYLPCWEYVFKKFSFFFQQYRFLKSLKFIVVEFIIIEYMHYEIIAMHMTICDSSKMLYVFSK